MDIVSIPEQAYADQGGHDLRENDDRLTLTYILD